MNILYKIKETFDKTTDLKDIEQVLDMLLEDKIYSYIVINNDDIKCQFMMCVKDKYNTLSKQNVLQDIIKALSNNDRKVFGQPSLDIMIEMYEPYIRKLAHEQYEHWQFLEYDDLLQMCYLSLVKLYRKGYYLNNLILRTTYIRDVLLSIRKLRTDYTVISVEDKYGEDESLSIKDILEDTNYSNDIYDKEHLEEILYIFNEMKDIIIEMIGERRFDQLFREYKDKTTTASTRQTLNRIKRELASNNITMNSFRK